MNSYNGKNPYQVLGVSSSATDDEIKSAYRDLARKYHPDKYRDSDLASLAEEKMKEINAAYEEIQKMRSAGGSAGNSNGSYASGTSADPRYASIRQNINSGNIKDAEDALNSVHEGDRGAEWNFLMGCVMVKKNYFVDAQKYFDTACAMDPRNMEYRNARDSLRMRMNGYQGGYYTSGNRATGCSGCDVCTGLLCADCCCECMGGDLIRCC